MTESTVESVSAPNFSGWFIGIGVVFLLVMGWFALDQPGRPLHDGDYGCSAGSLAYGGPGATVEGGQVVDVWDFTMRDGRTSLRWRDAKQTSPNEFSVTSEAPGPDRGLMRTYVCSYD